MKPAHHHRMAIVFAGLAALALASSFPLQVHAQGAAQPASKTTGLSRKQAEERLSSGYKALQGKKPKVAARELTAAIQSGKLPSRQMARALYLRGRAHGASERPADAIADLTSALWIKGALSKKDRADALALRKQLYSQAGVNGSVFSTTTTTAGATTQANTPSPQPTVAPQAKPKRTSRRASVPLPTPKKSVVASAGTSRSRASKQANLPTTTGSTNDNPFAAVNQGVSTFFNNLFGTGQSSATTTSASNANSSQILKNDNAKSVSSWNVATQTGTQSNSPPRRVARATPAKRARRPSSAQGKYFVQVATFRTAGQAQAVANQVATKYPTVLAGRTPSVEPDVLGNMGKFFFVRVRAYGSEADTRQLCKTLLANGLDCLVKRSN